MGCLIKSSALVMHVRRIEGTKLIIFHHEFHHSKVNGVLDDGIIAVRNKDAKDLL